MSSFLDRVWEILAGKKQPNLSVNQEGTSPVPKFLGEQEQGEDAIYQNFDFIKERIKSHVEVVSRSRNQFERGWFQKISYYIGNQWIKWDDARRDYRPRNLKRKWVPKPVTNRLASTVDTIRGALETIKIDPSFWPATADANDIAAAAVSEKVRFIIDDEAELQRVKREISAWVTLCGDAFSLPYYDKGDTTLGFVEIPSEECLLCNHVAQPKDFQDAGKCPGCGLPLMTQPAIKEDGTPITEKYAIGRMKVAVLSPLELYCSLDNRSWSEVQKWTWVRSYDLDYIRSRYPHIGDKVASSMGTAGKQSLHYLNMIAYMTMGSTQTAARSQGPKSALWTHFEMPNSVFPKGLLAVMSDDMTILEAGPSPWFEETPQGEKCYYNPIDHFGYMEVPGRLYSKTPVDDLIPKQDQRNRIESLMELSLMKGVYNTWLIPTGSSIQRIVGDPSQIIRWTPQGTNGSKPEVITSDPFSDACMKWLEKIDSDFEELGGTFDALKGNVPRGVSAGYAIQLLTEKSFGRFGTVFNNLESNHRSLYKKLLMVFRQNVTEPRLYKIKGDTGQWEIEAFVGSDIKGSIDIKTEGGASRPRTKLAEQALVEMFTKLGILNAQDPEQRFKIAELFGMGHMLGSYGDDQREAAREWWEFTQGKPPTMLPGVDNHMIHSLEHKRMAKTDVFRQMPEELQNFWLLHIQDHENMLMMAMQAQTPPAKAGKPEPPKPVISKATENPDQGPNPNRGSVSMGSGGENQHV
jgi:hypothetical protein